MLSNILHFYDKGLEALEKGVPLAEIKKLKVIEKIGRMKYIEEKRINEIKAIKDEIDKELSSLVSKVEG